MKYKLEKVLCFFGFHSFEMVRGDDPRMAEYAKHCEEKGYMFEKHWLWDLCGRCGAVEWIDI